MAPKQGPTADDPKPEEDPAVREHAALCVVFAAALLGNPRIDQLCGWPASMPAGQDDRGARLAALTLSLVRGYSAHVSAYGAVAMSPAEEPA